MANSLRDKKAPRLGLVCDDRGHVVKADPHMTPHKFRTSMQYFLEKEDFEHVKKLRVGTWLETKEAVDSNNLHSPPKTTTLKSTLQNTRLPHRSFASRIAARREKKESSCIDRKPKTWFLPPLTPRDVKCQIVVAEEDTLACAASLHDELKAQGNPDGVVAVLNMACFKHPGGGLLFGAGAQEENLCRRTNLLAHLKTAEYPLDIAECHVSRGVYYFRGTEADGYPMLKPEMQKRICVLSSAGYNCPPLVKDDHGEGRLQVAHATGLYLTMCAILRGAKDVGAKRVVLSALGCGAYGTPPADVARLFAHAIKNEAVQGKIVFAILSDHRHGSDNVEIFRREFSGFGNS